MSAKKASGEIDTQKTFDKLTVADKLLILSLFDLDLSDFTLTQVVQFEVEPAKQHALIADIMAGPERRVRHRRASLLSTFHATLDGRHVLNDAQWRTEANFHAVTRDPESDRLGAAIRAVGPAGRPAAVQCRVLRCIEPQQLKG